MTLLLDHGADIHYKTSAGVSAWTLAASAGFSDIIQLLAKKSTCQQAVIEDATATLPMAIERGQVSLVECLLQVGADINQPRPQDGYSPVKIAVEKGHYEVLHLLLQKGVHVHTLSADVQSVLALACQHKQWAMVQLLLDYFPDHEVVALKCILDDTMPLWFRHSIFSKVRAIGRANEPSMPPPHLHTVVKFKPSTAAAEMPRLAEGMPHLPKMPPVPPGQNRFKTESLSNSEADSKESALTHGL